MTDIALYADFDGVFNIPKNTKNAVTAKVRTRDSVFLKKHTNISWNPEVLEIFMKLIATGKYDFTWLTTWNDAGNIHHATEAMGIEELDEHVPANLNENAKGKKEWTRWKAETVIEDQKDKPRPYIWIDDDAPIFWEDYVTGNTLAPSLIIKPHWREGLTKKDLIKIIDWTIAQQNWRK